MGDLDYSVSIFSADNLFYIAWRWETLQTKPQLTYYYLQGAQTRLGHFYVPAYTIPFVFRTNKRVARPLGLSIWKTDLGMLLVGSIGGREAKVIGVVVHRRARDRCNLYIVPEKKKKKKKKRLCVYTPA